MVLGVVKRRSPGLRIDLAGDALPWVVLTLSLGAASLLLLRKRPAWGLAPALLWAGLWGSLWRPPTERPAPASGPTLVVVTLDTFRADHLGALGGPTPTPNLDALADRGALYRRAVTTAPLTAPAHASMWTGLSTPEHGLSANGDVLEVETVVPALREAGYRTGAFLSSAVLGRETGLGRGWDHYEDRWTWRDRAAWIPGIPTLLGSGPGQRRGDATVSRALAWLAEDERPALLWVHLYDPHAPYHPPAEFMPTAEQQAEAVAQSRTGPAPESVDEWTRTLEQRQEQSQRLLYQGELRWTDALVGRLAEGLPEDAVLVVLGDHGEGFGEHGDWYTHGGNLFEPSLRVPLITVGLTEPGFEEDGLVSIQGLAGTLADAAGVPWEGPRFTVREEVLAFTPGQQARRPVDSAPPENVAALRRGESKLVAWETRGVEAYDLGTDPTETAPTPPSMEDPGVGELEALLASPPPPLDDAAREQLRALGYFD